MREIEHRAKNSLALVQGIVRLSRARSFDEFSRLVQGRVDALSNAHVIIADGRLRDVPLERLLSIETEHVGRKVTLAGPYVEITSAQVQQLPLVVHELIANAIRFGALSVTTGSMSISWEIAGSNVVLTMSEQQVRQYRTCAIRVLAQQSSRQSSSASYAERLYMIGPGQG